VILGRGSFTESFPLFGYPLDMYEELFEEKLDLFAPLLHDEPETLSGATRAPLQHQNVFPRTERRLTTWVGVGGSPGSVVRAPRHAPPLVSGITGGRTRRVAPL